MNKEQINEAVNNALKTGNWMIRTENKGAISPSSDAKGFKWKPIGQWTEAPDWNTEPQCGHGLHGQTSQCGGDGILGKYVVFCETKGEQISIDNNKIKVQFARRLIYRQLPIIEKWESSLDLSGCDLKGITLPQSVGGWLDLSGCDLKGITLPQSVGGWLYLSGCDLKGITLPQSVGGSLYLSGCDLKGITLPAKMRNKLYK